MSLRYVHVYLCDDFIIMISTLLLFIVFFLFFSGENGDSKRSCQDDVSIRTVRTRGICSVQIRAYGFRIINTRTHFVSHIVLFDATALATSLKRHANYKEKLSLCLPSHVVWAAATFATLMCVRV